MFAYADDQVQTMVRIVDQEKRRISLSLNLQGHTAEREQQQMAVGYAKPKRNNGTLGDLRKASMKKKLKAPVAPLHTMATSRSNPGRFARPEADRPRSSSMTSTSWNPSSFARSARAYWRR